MELDEGLHGPETRGTCFAQIFCLCARLKFVIEFFSRKIGHVISILMFAPGADCSSCRSDAIALKLKFELMTSRLGRAVLFVLSAH